MTACPGTDELRRLLLEEPGGDAQRALETHVEECASCQRALERMAAAGPSWDQAARHLATGNLKEEALAHAVDHLENTPRTPADDQTRADPLPDSAQEFTYLEPSRLPGHLGRLDHYEIIEVVGRGGMGVVFKAHDERLHRVVALKVLGPQYTQSSTARKRFTREARAAAAASHENVVSIHEVAEARGIPYLVMPLIAGQSLEARVDEAGPLPIETILRIGTQTARGLAAAHRQGLVHRDVKPANILLESGTNQVKITDFGLARAVDDGTITQSGVITGTPMFMAPEQARCGTVDQRADLFSLGSVLYFMSTGRLPFRVQGTHAILHSIIHDTPRPLREVNPDVPQWFEAIVAKLHAKRPEDRFASAEEVADLLAQHLAHLQEPRRVALPAPVAPPAEKTERLLDGTDRFKRIVQQAGMLAGLGFLALGGLIALVAIAKRDGGEVCFGLIVMAIGGFGWMIVSRIRQRWHVVYRGHDITVEANYFRGETLFIDDIAVARGGFGKRVELRGLIRDGDGSGDEIVVRCEARLLSHRCRMLVDRGAVRVAPPVYTLQYAGRTWGAVALTFAGLLVAGGCGLIGVLFGGAIVGMLGALALLRPQAPVVDAPKEKAADKAWVALFNGKSFDRWIAPPPDSVNWQIDKSGHLVGRGTPAPILLLTERDDFEDFHLRLEANVGPGADGSLFFRAKSQAQPEMLPAGYRVILGHSVGFNTGTLLSMMRPDGLLPIKPLLHSVHPERVAVSTWFKLDVIARGTHLIVQINDAAVVDCVDEAASYERGRIAIKVDSPQAVIQFRKIEIQELAK